MGPREYERDLTLLATSQTGFFSPIQYLVVQEPRSVSQELGKQKQCYYCATD